MRTIHLSFLGVIHKIFQLELATQACRARLSWLVKLYENLTYVHMWPAAIALNYSVKDIQNDVHQIIYIIYIYDI